MLVDRPFDHIDAGAHPEAGHIVDGPLDLAVAHCDQLAALRLKDQDATLQPNTRACIRILLQGCWEGSSTTNNVFASSRSPDPTKHSSCLRALLS